MVLRLLFFSNWAGKLTEMGCVAGVESSALGSKCSRWRAPHPFSARQRGQDSGVPRIFYICEGSIVWLSKTDPFPSDTPVESREQITNHILSILCLSYPPLLGLALLSVNVCVCVCTHMCVHMCEPAYAEKKELRKNGKDVCTQEKCDIKI